ncbi:MAG TPA: amino acid--[acyl-carrier-protein] ligase [Hyphomicrobiales bacterium]|nr:amino acid--[acyl-carrier-protein] ligase [Hyphomicrobiales bacterium]
MNIHVASPAADEAVRAERLKAIRAEHLVPAGADGVYLRSGVYEDVVERLAALISRQREPDTEVLRFPPVMSRARLEKSGYLKSFPNLLGTVSALHGSDAEIMAAAGRLDRGEDWTEGLAASDLVLAPAACYPVYPLAASRGAVPRDGLRFDVAADCFRHEPSEDLMRLQSFRMREYVCIGSPRQIQDFRDRWMARARGLADALALPHEVEQANDPFFGRVGQMMAMSQREQSLKFELVVPVVPGASASACMSFNYHREHFGEVWGLRDTMGELAHTGCVAFGMDRLAVALFATHGLVPRNWPAEVRGALML